LSAVADFRAHGNIVRRPIAVDDLQILHVDRIARYLEPDHFEAAFAAADLDHVAVNEKTDLLAAELLPFVGGQIRLCSDHSRYREKRGGSTRTSWRHDVLPL